jgi:hypothetical protein
MSRQTFLDVIKSGNVEAARCLVRSRDTDHVTQEQILSSAVTASAPGMARMLASEGVLSVANIVWTPDLLQSRCVAGELLICGASPPEASSPLEGALFDAIVDLRASAVAAHIASGMAVIDPSAFHRAMAKMRGCEGCVSGRELLHVISSCYNSCSDKFPRTPIGTGPSH